MPPRPPADAAVAPTANEFGQPISYPVDDWQRRPFPGPDTFNGRLDGGLRGRLVSLEALEDRHVGSLFASVCAPGTEPRWTYMPAGPFATVEAYRAYCDALIADTATVPLAILDRRTGEAVGVACYLRIDPAVGSLEVGSIMFSPQLAGTAGATEAMYLMAAHALDDLGYRRYEWKCDALNASSRSAALRLGFSFEGIFRQATMYKGRNRDTAWYAMTSADWPAIKAAFVAWLAAGNFDVDGNQQRSLSSFRQLTPRPETSA